jgi:excisionase family DNA binding protein
LLFFAIICTIFVPRMHIFIIFEMIWRDYGAYLPLFPLIYPYFLLIPLNMSSNIIVKRICDYCKNSFDAKTTKTKYCSHICNSRGYKLNQKLKKIETSDTETKSKVSNYVVDLNSKDFLTVKETSTLLNMSSKTIYKLIEQKDLNAYNFSVRKTLIRRKDIEGYFENNYVNDNYINPNKKNEINPGNSYTINEAIEKFNISNGALYTIIKRHNIQKEKHGKFTLVKKEDLNKIFQQAI